MNVAERLMELHEAWDQGLVEIDVIDEEAGTLEDRVMSVLNALPEIAAVIEAAEALASLPGGLEECDCDECDKFVAQRRALAALSSRLGNTP